ncbi:MAG: PIN domain-containing protein [Actinomycetota bacterium]|nr:PIN domain-containing protein [Actinomycetota bacterium]
MLLVDTNVFLAAADRRSDRHGECAALLRTHASEIATTVPVIAETSWLILDRLGTRSQSEFVRMVVAGRPEALDLTATDWRRCAELVEHDTDLRLDVMDASLVAVAERLGAQAIATMNRRDFAVVRPSHVEAFELVP